MQPTVQSEQDKMVPIDTSGDPVEIEVKEEEKEDTANVEVQETDTVEEPQSDKKEEQLEEYSASVKRRIDKLTRKMREAERREQAAIEYATKVNDKYKQALTLGTQKDETNVTSRESAVTAREEFAKRALEAAVQAQDVEKQVAAQQEISKLAIEKEKIALAKQRVEQAKANPPQGEPMPQDLQKSQPAQQTEQTEQVIQPDPKAQEWQSQNKWFGKDKMMTYAAMGLHEDLMEEGFDATSDEYYNEINSRLKEKFPALDGGKSRPTQKVASAVRTSPSGRRTVKLTPSQVAIAKKLGVPLEEYAKHVKEA
jgi:hypothetical protein